MTHPTASHADRFQGFPAIGKATAIPNALFGSVLSGMQSAGALLAFLWVSKLVQEQRADARFVTEEQLWAQPGAAKSFNQIANGRADLSAGLTECVTLGALIALPVTGEAGRQTLYFINNPTSRRSVLRARAGELRLIPETVVARTEAALEEARPGIFRLYEEHIGTITPMVGDRLIDAEERFPADWIEDAFREAAELNKRSWRYVERILANWAEEGRSHETLERDSLEDRKQRYLGNATRNR
ncbi:MAG: DnaD domain protein [Tepidiformaceae bacterium]